MNNELNENLFETYYTLSLNDWNEYLLIEKFENWSQKNSIKSNKSDFENEYK